MQQIVNKAQEFYDINDIEINPKKSELIVLNRKKTEKEYNILLGKKKEEVKAKNTNDTVRLLGVWIGGKSQKRKCRLRL